MQGNFYQRESRELRPCSGDRQESQAVIPIRTSSGKRVFDARLDKDGGVSFVIRARNIDASISLDEVRVQIESYRDDIRFEYLSMINKPSHEPRDF